MAYWQKNRLKSKETHVEKVVDLNFLSTLVLTVAKSNECWYKSILLKPICLAVVWSRMVFFSRNKPFVDYIF